MKLSKLFHSLYAVLMFLPVMVIPIFAININQKSVEPIQVEVQEKVSVDFNQIYEYRNESNIYVTSSNNNGLVNITINNDTSTLQRTRLSAPVQIYENHIYYFRTIPIMPSDTLNDTTQIYLNLPNNAYPNLTYQKQSVRFTSAESMLTSFNIQVQTNLTDYTFQVYINCFDLTQMYGVGNEPTTEDFLEKFPLDNYDYTLSREVLIDSVIATYNDTDIGSQFLYSLYIPVKEYFNFGNFFGLNGMYDWFTLNIFNGTAPLSFFIVFNVMIYWLFISLFWLLFDILIYVPMVIHKWLDKAEM